ncbi:hypothetical protein [Acetobacterium wieringae]|uniref:hypothetical protein n=1 Tax=Acetobacterium wieringae TaxID=52694 RepID=UPI00203447B2|nr:hypothetical protein [Acetobacterium wieringae]URN83120.1 hypothetical protein CHL1_002237 [Acetobacterium wieringae]
MGVGLALVVDHRGDVDGGAFSFNHTDQFGTDKQGVVGIAAFADGGVGGPLGNGPGFALFGAGATGIGETDGVRLPADFAELAVDQVTGLGLAQLKMIGCGLACLARCGRVAGVTEKCFSTMLCSWAIRASFSASAFLRVAVSAASCFS